MGRRPPAENDRAFRPAATPPRAAAARAAYQRARWLAVRSCCLSPVGVYARAPGQLGLVAFARVAKRQIDRLVGVIPINAARPRIVGILVLALHGGLCSHRQGDDDVNLVRLLVLADAPTTWDLSHRARNRKPQVGVLAGGGEVITQQQAFTQIEDRALDGASLRDSN